MRALIIAALLHLLSGCASAPVQASAATPASQPAATIAPARAAPAPDDVVAVIPLQHAMAEQMAHDVRSLLSSRYECRLVPNGRSNTIVAVGTQAEIAKIKELVASLDTPPVAGR